MACTSARGEERLQSLDSAQDADQALLPLFLSLSFFLSPSRCLSISCEFVARCDCNCMCRYESSYILHSTFCAPHFIFLFSFSYTAWSENCNLHCFFLHFFIRMPRESGKNVNWKCSYAISICLACSAAKIAEQFCVFGPEPPLLQLADSCTYLRAYTQHCSQLLLVTIVCFTSSQKHLAFYAKCLRRDQEKESCQLHEKFNILHAHTQTH